MKRSKKIFLVFAGIFFLIMIVLGYDISRRTTFPGSRKLIIESLSPSDSTSADSTYKASDKKTKKIEAGEEN